MKEITREQIREILNKEMVQNSTVDKIYELLTQPEPKKFEVWKPNLGDKVFSITGMAIDRVFSFEYDDTTVSKYLYAMGLIFRTRQDAFNHVAHLKAKKKLQDELAVMNAEANGGVEYVEDRESYHLHYDVKHWSLDSGSNWKSDVILHPAISETFDGLTTIGTLTEEEVRLAFGVFE